MKAQSDLIKIIFAVLAIAFILFVVYNAVKILLS